MIIVNSYVLCGINSQEVRVETDMMRGLPQFTIVGLADTEVQESRSRIRSSLVHAGFSFPAQKIVINLAPASVRKASSSLDVPIAMGILAISKQIRQLPDNVVFVGELSLGGDIRPVRGIITYMLAAKEQGKYLVIPKDNEEEARICGDHYVPVAHLSDILEYIENGTVQKTSEQAASHTSTMPDPVINMSSIVGLDIQKRALMIAAVGRHNVCMVGGPGSGKSLLANALPGILPKLTQEESLEVMKIYSSIGTLPKLHTRYIPPFRSVHHTATVKSITGGGHRLLPGEISLAHKGVLFFDELPEFKREVLEVLREPLEDDKIVISRASGRMEYPAECMFIAAQNPCPCGYAGVEGKTCTCHEYAKERYLSRISGPLLDRMDIFLRVPKVSADQLVKGEKGTSSNEMRKQVEAARLFARNTRSVNADRVNARLQRDELEKGLAMDKHTQNIFINIAEKLQLSSRGIIRIMRVARSIADLAYSESVKEEHILEAVHYRSM